MSGEAVGLRELAEKANTGAWWSPGGDYHTAQFIAAANPEVVLALLDVAEAAKKAHRINVGPTACKLCNALSRLEAVTGGARAAR